MNKNIIILIAIAFALLLVWLAPVFAPEAFIWLGSGWQILLTLLLILPWPLFRLWKYYRLRHSVTAQEKLISRQDEQQRKQRLNDDWNQLWGKLHQQHGSNPYILPWLMMLGTDGSGKTGWLIDAGFERITSKTENQRASIVFWLSEYAVIIELAGHYYTRDKESVAEELWQHLIKLLKRKRPRRPLTGVMAALSTDQLVLRQPSGLLELARQLRWRLMELNRQFGLQLPAWFMLTQADRLNGFTELFRNFSQQKQVTPWGFSLQEGYRSDHFRQSFNHCHRELFSSLLSALQHEKDGNARRALMRYSLQFTLLGERLRFFCEEIFQTQLDVPAPELKGIWFSSTGQYDSSINLLASELARIHGFTVLMENPQTQSSQSFFNQQFFSRIILNDMGGVGENPVARKLWQFRTAASIAALFILLFAGLGFCWRQIEFNNQLLQEQQAVVRDYRFAVRQLDDNSSLVDAIPPLYKLRQLNDAYQKSSRGLYRLGLLDWNQAETIQQVYQTQLQLRLLKPLTSLLHDQLETAERQQRKTLFNDLQFYLMLYKPDIRDTPQLEKHILRILARQKNLETTDQQQLALLLKDVWQLEKPRIKQDLALTDKASQSLAGQLDEKIIYGHIQALPQYQGTVSMKELFGDDFDQLFILKNSDTHPGFPRLYTRNQYETLNLSPLSPLLKQELGRLNRIRKGLDSVSSVELSRISSKIRELYFQDYIRAWQNLLSRIELRPVVTTQQLSQQLSTLYSGEQAPLFNLIATVSSETQLAEESNSANPVVASKKLAVATQSSKIQKISMAAQRASYLIPDSANDKSIPTDSPAIVNRAFAPYADFEKQQTTTLAPVLSAIVKELQGINAHYDQNQALYEQAIKIIQDKDSQLPMLWQLAATDKTVAGKWFEQIANQIWQHSISGASRHAQKRWQNDVYAFYSQYLNHRFPLSAQSNTNSQLGDFVDFFKPKGLFDSFTGNVLQPFIISTDSGWQLKLIRGQKLALSRNFLIQLNNVKALQKGLFNADGSLQVKYKMRCTELTPQATEFSLRDNNGRFIYRHGPQLWQERLWPSDETEQLTASMLDSNQKLSQQSFSGTWAWLRFVFDCQQWQNGDRIELRYSHKGYDTKLELAMDRRVNPFSRELYGRVNLPEQLSQ